jgi:hypothetical protein
MAAGSIRIEVGGQSTEDRKQQAGGSDVIRYSLFGKSVALSCLDGLNDLTI